MSYYYASNLDSFNRLDQLEIQLDNGDTAILRKGHYYDLTAGELARARQYITLTASTVPADERPVGVYRLMVKGNPNDGDVPVWEDTEGVFIPQVASGGGGSADDSMSEVFNVRTYGATGDGVTDDTTACQNALNAARDANGGCVYFPRGTYYTGKLLVYDNTQVLGAGRHATWVKLKNGANDNLFQTSKWGILTTGNGTNSYITFRSFSIEGNNTNQTLTPAFTRAAGAGWANGATTIVAESTAGFDPSGALAAGRFTEIPYSSITGNTFNLVSPTTGSGPYRTHIQSKSTKGHGIAMQGQQCTIEDVYIQNCAANGIMHQGYAKGTGSLICADARILNVRVKSCSRGGLEVGPSGSDGHAVTCTFSTNGKFGLLNLAGGWFFEDIHTVGPGDSTAAGFDAPGIIEAAGGTQYGFLYLDTHNVAGFVIDPQRGGRAMVDVVVDNLRYYNCGNVGAFMNTGILIKSTTGSGNKVKRHTFVAVDFADTNGAHFEADISHGPRTRMVRQQGALNTLSRLQVRNPGDFDNIGGTILVGADTATFTGWTWNTRKTSAATADVSGTFVITFTSSGAASSFEAASSGSPRYVTVDAWDADDNHALLTVQYTGISGTTLTGCTVVASQSASGGVFNIPSSTVVSQAYLTGFSSAATTNPADTTLITQPSLEAGSIDSLSIDVANFDAGSPTAINSGDTVLIGDTCTSMDWATGASTQLKKASVVFANVKEASYGALGDGTTDDRAAIQAAIDQTSAAGGGVVWLPAGTYRLGATLEMKTGVTLRGAGRRVSKLRPLAALTGQVVHVSSSNAVVDIAIEDLEIDGGFDLGISVACILCTTVSRAAVRRVYAHNSGLQGIVMQSNSPDCVVERCTIELTGQGSSSSGFGVNLSNAPRGVVELCRIIDCLGTGILISGSSQFSAESRVIGNYVRQNATATKDCIVVNAGSDSCVVEGNICDDGGDTCISVLSIGSSVTGNTCSGAQHSVIVLGGANCAASGNIAKNGSKFVSATKYAGVEVTANGCTVTGNRCFDDQGTKTQDYGVQATVGLTDLTITGNEVANNLLGGINGVSDGINGCIVQANGGAGLGFSAVTSAVTLGPERVVQADATGGAFTITLPASADSGRRYDIKRINSGANNVTVSGGAQTIDGVTTYVLQNQYESVTVVSNGTNWVVV